MKWRLLDKIEEMQAGHAIVARKAISFEEYSLLKVFGRKGSFPESLVLESCVEAARWLVAASSEFKQTCALSGVESFAFAAEAGRGQALTISLTVTARDECGLQVACDVRADNLAIAHGSITVSLSPLHDSFDPEFVRGMWRELYAKAA